MAAEDYIRDLSAYLTSGKLSDLTLKLGGKNWQIHKALACCHSKWFDKAVTSGYEEAIAGVVTLKDDLEFTDAVDCMVSYFYNAKYDATGYNTPEPLLHAQVITIADKYDCASLNKLATKSFANTIQTVEGDDWAAIATVVYEHTTADSSAHADLRSLVVAAIAGRHSVLTTTMRHPNVVELLRSNADLATDLLLGGLPENTQQHIFSCSNCYYVHVGRFDCPSVVSDNRYGLERLCPKCGKESGATSKRYTYKVNICRAFPCPSCSGSHTIDPGVDSDPEAAPIGSDLWGLNGVVR